MYSYPAFFGQRNDCWALDTMQQGSDRRQILFLHIENHIFGLFGQQYRFNTLHQFCQDQVIFQALSSDKDCL